MAGYTRQSSGLIVTGQTIQASHFNNEYDAILAAFDATTGHAHDGTTGGGASLPPTALASLSSNGLVARISTSAFAARTLTAPAAGITVTNGNGVSGNPTLVLANDLSALEGLSSTGFAARTASDTWAQRTLTAPAAGFTITNGDGVSGNPTFVLANDLAALEAMSSTGIVVRTASETYSNRTITGTANQITVTNGSGVSGNPTLSLPDSIVLGSADFTVDDLDIDSGNSISISAANDFNLSITDTFDLDADIVSIGGASQLSIGSSGGSILITSDANDIRLSAPNDAVYIGSAALSTSATVGHFWIPSCAGAPTGNAGAPYYNAAAIIVDTTNSRLYVRVGSTWKYVTLT